MSPSLPPRTWILFAGLFTVIWFGALDVRALHHPDEGRYAEIAREMQASGDWVTPRLNGLKYFEKPPLQYWLTAASFAALGVHDWTARLPAALFGWLTIVAIGVAGARVAGRPTGWLAAAVLASMVWPIGLAHFLTLDAVLTGWLTLAFAAFVIAQTGAPAQRRAFMLAAWAASAGAVLTKGLVGLAVPGGALLLYTLVTRDFALWRRLALLPGLALMLVVCVPWFALVSARNPEFAQFFFIHEHVQRFLTTQHQREGAWWYFVPLLLLGLLPWTAALGAGALTAWRAAPRTPDGFSWLRFAWAWIAFVFLFFSLSGSKLPSYVLPLFPPAALIVAWHVERLS
jgi:4-amino-4-deoxy-L-arabinose transferase-like glycosyltransferase